MPSSLVRARPVSSTLWLKYLAWLMAFWPVPASSTSSTSCGASASSLPITRRTFFSSSIRLSLVCRRPAVSAISTSAPRALAACTASKITDAESAPVCWAITGIWLRSPHTCSCSTAAARKVSPAASMTFLPSSCSFFASLPMVVVLPAPFTPTTRIT
ncbi:hypothetical protein D3C80_1621530 [compost metagenome]